MNELLCRAWNGEELVTRSATQVPMVDPQKTREYRFNGDRASFVNADFQDFYSLLESGNAVWLNDNIVAYKDKLPDNLSELLWDHLVDGCEWVVDLNFDEELFSVLCFDGSQELEAQIFHMLLDSQRGRNIKD
jgi:hypothetical protein